MTLSFSQPQSTEKTPKQALLHVTDKGGSPKSKSFEGSTVYETKYWNFYEAGDGVSE